MSIAEALNDLFAKYQVPTVSEQGCMRYGRHTVILMRPTGK
jgi:hypothetical protein